MRAIAMVTCMAIITLTTNCGVAAEPPIETKTTIGLVAHVAADHEPELAATGHALVDLVEAGLARSVQLVLVERRHLDATIAELGVSRSLGGRSTLPLLTGRIRTASLLAELQVRLDSKQPGEVVQVQATVVESQTGRIRGSLLRLMTPDDLLDAADEVTRFVETLAIEPGSQAATVAVVPFESQGRFDRLRPLERGIRDMAVSRLLSWSELSSGEGSDWTPRAFQVVQRSGMQHLLAEQELLRSALVDHSDQSGTQPRRGSMFVLRGEIDERNDSGMVQLSVSGELVDLATMQVTKRFQFRSPPANLDDHLAQAVDEVAGHLNGRLALASSPPTNRGSILDRREVDELYRSAVSDLLRLHRCRPIDASHRRLETSGKIRPSGAPVQHPDSPLGTALLKKSFDRLEAVLYVRPDHAEASYALAFASSFGVDEISNLDRAEDLLKRAAGSDPHGPRGAAALRLLAEVNYHHDNMRVPPGREHRAAACLEYSFTNMPEEYRDQIWARIPSEMSSRGVDSNDADACRRVRDYAWQLAEVPEARYQYELARGVASLSFWLQSDGDAGHPEVLSRWISGEDWTLRHVAYWSLAQHAVALKHHADAADWFLAGVESLDGDDDSGRIQIVEMFRIHAARALISDGRIQQAQELLESFTPHDGQSLNVAYRAIELARCYIATSERQKAVSLLADTAERVPGTRDNTQVEEMIRELGGIPLREDRDIDVELIHGADGRTAFPLVLATDGRRLFCTGVRSTAGVSVYDTQTSIWTTSAPEVVNATAAVYRHGELWIGTAHNGLHRYRVDDGVLKPLPPGGDLPDLRITCLAGHNDGLFAGVGTPASGGMVWIDRDGAPSDLDSESAPSQAPQTLAIQGDVLIAATRSAVHEYSLSDSQWRRLPDTYGRSVFSGSRHAWVSGYGRELAPYGADEQMAAEYQKTWFKGRGRSGYVVAFVTEHNDRIWFGGSPWERFHSVGVYTLEPRTGAFQKYNLRDGFPMSTTYSAHAAVAIGDDLWIATSGGLVRVRERMASGE